METHLYENKSISMFIKKRILVFMTNTTKKIVLN